MSVIEKLSYSISNKLGNRLDKSDEEIKVLNYGLFVILHTFMVMIAMLIVGVITKSIVEIMTIAICSAVLKRYSGGVHASTPGRCLVVGVTMTTILMIVGKFIVIKSDAKFLFMLLSTGIVTSYYMIYTRCPVGSKQKPLKNKEKRIFLRRKTFRAMNVFSVAIIISFIMYFTKNSMYMKSISISILSGVLIQIFALSKTGERVIVGIDKYLN